MCRPRAPTGGRQVRADGLLEEIGNAGGGNPLKRLQARPVERSAWRAAGIFGALIAAIAIAAVATPWPIGLARATDALVVLGSGKRTESIVVATGKSQNIRTDSNFVDVVVGDSEIADVMPLTDHSLSILGKKIGTTRVSDYAEGKKLVGVLDSEATYDSPTRAGDLRKRFRAPRFRLTALAGLSEHWRSSD